MYQMKKNDSSSWSNQFDNLSSQKQIATNLLIEWYDKARPTQLVEDSDEFNIHLFLAGRGWGKTLTGAYDIVEYCLRNDNVVCGVVAPTYGDLKRVVFSGDSGFINIIDRRLLSNTGYNKSDSEIHFYNGSKIIGFPAIEPDRLRGVQFHRAWCDELASWRYTETFDNLMMALRLGHNPKCIITTTPRPTKIIRSLAKRSDTKLITGSTFENIDNLAESSIEMLRERYEGTRIGRQELYAEILEDVEGALFNYKNIEENRLIEYPNDLQRIVVAIDPAVTSNQNSDETGMIVAGRDVNNHYYILHDASQISSPDEWVKKAISLYKQYECDRIVAEVNNGGDLIERLLRTQNQSIPYTSVRASRGKIVRAEPISALYEQNRVHHVGVFKDLEEQMCQFTGNGVQYHDDRVDALVWAITSLQNSGQAVFKIS